MAFIPLLVENQSLCINTLFTKKLATMRKAFLLLLSPSFFAVLQHLSIFSLAFSYGFEVMLGLLSYRLVHFLLVFLIWLLLLLYCFPRQNEEWSISFPHLLHVLKRVVTCTPPSCTGEGNIWTAGRGSNREHTTLLFLWKQEDDLEKGRTRWKKILTAARAILRSLSAPWHSCQFLRGSTASVGLTAARPWLVINVPPRQCLTVFSALTRFF